MLSPVEMNQLRSLHSHHLFQKNRSTPSSDDIKNYNDDNEIDAIVRFHEKIKNHVPNFDQYKWFIFHTGYLNNTSDILVAYRNENIDNLSQQWSIQNIEIKRYASSYLFQPQLNANIRYSDGTLEINSLSHAYLNQFNANTKSLEQIIINAIQNDKNYKSITGKYVNASSVQSWLNTYMKGREYAVLLKDIQIPNVEELVKKFYFDCYDLNRQVTVFQIGNGKNARLFKVSNIKSNHHIDPLQLLNGRTNTFSSAFNTILLTVEIRKTNNKGTYKIYGKLRFSNRKANIIGSFDPQGDLPQ